jgi:hypothetical protein
MQDARSRRLAESLANEQKTLALRGVKGSTVGQFMDAAAKNTPGLVLKTLMEESDASFIRAAVLELVRKQFSNMILIPSEQIDDHKPLSLFGVDSMLAAEFRSWLWTMFKVDIPFLDLVNSQKALSSIAGDIEERLHFRSSDNGSMPKV